MTDTNGRIVTTGSGTVYVLGEVKPEYRAYVENELHREWKDEQPIKMLRRRQ